MKNLIFIFIFVTTVQLFAGDKIGNGGGIWACYTSDQVLDKGLLVDFYEIKYEFGLNLISTVVEDPMEIVKERIRFVAQNLPDLNYQWRTYIGDTLDSLRFVNSELLVVEDALYRIKPSKNSCASGWRYEQFANFTEYQQVLISREFWESKQISAIDKAGLIWHEIIYSWLRVQYSDTNSVRARQIVGLLFSDLETEQIEDQINQVLFYAGAPHPVLPGTTIKSLYIASGLCNSGAGITTYTKPSNVITRWSDQGVFKDIFRDLNLGLNVQPGTSPQSMIDQGNSILLLTENSNYQGDRKIYRINKADPNVYTVYSSDPAAFTTDTNQITRSMAQDLDGSILFSKSSAVEKINQLGVRIPKNGTNPWISSPAITGNCFNPSATLISQVALMPPFDQENQGKLIYLHSGFGSRANRIGIIQRTGLSPTNANDCAGSSPYEGVSAVTHTNAPGLIGPVRISSSTGVSLTGMVYIPTPAPALTTGKLVVSYSGSANNSFDNNTNFNYGIVAWDIHETSDTVATLTNPTILWRDESVVWAPSAMTYDPATRSLYVAVAGSPGVMDQTMQNYGYHVEKFRLDLNTPHLTRIARGNRPFIVGNSYTKCISSMMLAK